MCRGIESEKQEIRQGCREMRDRELPDKELTDAIINAAITVHKTLGPGFLETIYEEALCIELTARNIPFERQKTVAIPYRDQIIGEHRLDLLVAGHVVVELKATKDLAPVFFAVVRSYLKAVDCHSGLLLNFAAMPLVIKRIGREYYGVEYEPERLT